MEADEREDRRKRGLSLGYATRQFELKHGFVAFRKNGRWVSQHEIFDKRRTNYLACKEWFRGLKK